MRWILVLLALGGFFVAFTTKSPGILGLALAVAIFSSLAFVFALAAARISANAQPEAMLIVDPEVTSLRARKLRLQQIQTNVRAIAQTSEGEHRLDS